jgi:Fe-S cluster assembly ATP-binding protein
VDGEFEALPKGEGFVGEGGGDERNTGMRTLETKITRLTMALLEINNLHARVAAAGGREILKGVNLTINRGEVHAIMGRNGSGKSTLAQVLAGRDAYEVTEGTVKYKGLDLLELSAEERAREGVFLAFQYPVEIPGVSTSYFLKAAVNAVRKHRGDKELDAVDFLNLVREKMKLLKMTKEFMNRAVNEGFSGGEKKRNEIFQMAVMDPTLALMDETDSGLDVEALKTVAEGAASLRHKDNAILVVTHYQRLLEYIVPDFVHVMLDGRLVMSGGKELAEKVDTQGYDWVEKEVAQTV